ncbi:MAG: hypothetical protein M1527_04745, partial [Gammaproteobacteria bacterium]|nr:hypothetical protein [Gammaproteobacteria bacterium]
SLETISACGYHKTMASHYSRLSAALLFALLQCFAPLLHAHFDAKTHDLSGVHQHDVVEPYCLDTSPCPDAKVEALDTQAVTITPAFPKKPSDSADPGILPFRFSSGQTQAYLAAIPPPSIAVPRWHFALPPAHAPPYIL